MGSPVRSESKAVVGKLFFVNRREDLRNSLLHKPVQYRGDSQFPDFPWFLFGYFYPADRAGLVGPALNLPD